MSAVARELSRILAARHGGRWEPELDRIQRYRKKVAGSFGRTYLSTTQRDRNPRTWLLAAISALVILAAPSPAEAKVDCGSQTRTAEQHWSWAEGLKGGYSIPAWAKSKHRFSVACAAGPNHRRVMQTRWERIKRSILPANYDLWIRIGRCEQPGSGHRGINWSHTGPTYQGGLGFYYRTWTGYKYPGMPSNAGYATWRQQMRVANRLLGLYGTSPWGCA